MNIKIEGMDELMKKLNDMKENLSSETIIKWTKKIEADARNMCNDTKGETISINVERQNPDKFSLLHTATNKEAINCLVKSFEINISQMPQETKYIFENFLHYLKTRISK